MYQFHYVITDPIGIHARPAGLLAKEAAKFQSKVVIEKDGKQADVRRLMAVMGLCIKAGTEIIVTVEGEDETVAGPAMEAFFQSNL